MEQKHLYLQTVAQEYTASFTKIFYVKLPSPALEIAAVKVESFTNKIIERQKGLLAEIQSGLKIIYIERDTNISKAYSQRIIQLSYLQINTNYKQALYQTWLNSNSVLGAALASPKQLVIKPNINLHIIALIKESLQLKDLSYYDNAVHVFTHSDGRLSIPRIGTIKVEID